MLGKLVTWSLVLGAGSAGGVMVGNEVLPVEFQPKKFAAHLEVFKTRRMNPMASPEQLRQVFDQTPEGIGSLVSTLRQIQATGSARGAIATRDSRAADQQASAPSDELEKLFADENSGPSNNGTHNGSHESPEEAGAKNTVLIKNSVGIDPSAEERVNSLNIPEQMKAEILRNYHRTGVLPSFEPLEKTAQRNPVGDEDGQ